MGMIGYTGPAMLVEAQDATVMPLPAAPPDDILDKPYAPDDETVRWTLFRSR
jgi:hypothetical protein